MSASAGHDKKMTRDKLDTLRRGGACGENKGTHRDNSLPTEIRMDKDGIVVLRELSRTFFVLIP